jgi:hypothetical protein
VGARADRGDAGGLVSAEEATEPQSQRKATAARSKTQSPARATSAASPKLPKPDEGIQSRLKFSSRRGQPFFLSDLLPAAIARSFPAWSRAAKICWDFAKRVHEIPTHFFCAWLSSCRDTFATFTRYPRVAIVPTIRTILSLTRVVVVDT